MKHLLEAFGLVCIFLFNFYACGGGRPEPVIGMPREVAATPTSAVMERVEEEVQEESINFDLGNLDIVEAVNEEVTEVNNRELEILQKCVEAEACDQDYRGKCLVARVILNRVESDGFPDTIKGVVYQKGQFEVVANGSIKNAKVSEDTIKACEEVLNGWDDSKGALYFRMQTKARNEWHYTALEFLFDDGTHSFFK